MRERTSKNGNKSYQVLFRHGGKQRSKSFTARKGAKDFESLIGILGIERALAELEGHTHQGPTLDEVAEQYWIYRATRVRSERTVADYKRDYKNWIADELGWRPAAEIDEERIQAWVDSMQKQLGAKTVGDKHAILHGIFKWASSPTRCVIPLGHNPCIGTELPKKHKKAPKVLRPAEWQALLIALDKINPDAADLAEFLLASGWRWSEATALDVYGTEDDGQHVWVTMGQVARRQFDGSVVIVQDAKSEAGLRRIKLDIEASALVRRRVAATGAGGLVFTTRGESAMWNYSHFRKRFWDKAVKAANLERKPAPHWLRHTSVAYLSMSGKVGISEIQRRLGHESIVTTLDTYGGMIEDISVDALSTFASLRGVRLPVITDVESRAIES